MRTTTISRIAAISAGLLLSLSATAAAQTEAGGYTFEQLVPLGGVVNVTDVAELPGGPIGVMGYDTDESGIDGSFVWGTDDSGETWTEARMDIPNNAVNAGLITLGDRFIAVGSRHIEDSSHTTWVFTSPDAVTWELASQIENAHVTTVVPTPEGVAMLGLDFRAAEGFGDRLGGYPTLWLSDDAAEWEASEITTPLIGKPVEQPGRLTELVRSDDGSWMASGMIIQGRDDQGPLGRTSIWHATPEMEWTEATAPIGSDSDFSVMRVAEWTPEGFLFSGGHFNHGGKPDDTGLWLTTDGTDWERVAETGRFPNIEVIVTNGSDIVAWKPPIKNTTKNPKVRSGAPMYTSTDARTWEHPAPHMLDEAIVFSAKFTPDGRLLMTGRVVRGCKGDDLGCVFEGSIPAFWGELLGAQAVDDVVDALGDVVDALHPRLVGGEVVRSRWPGHSRRPSVTAGVAAPARLGRTSAKVSSAASPFGDRA